MKTEWQGLWSQGHPGLYASKVFKKEDITELPRYTRILLKYNKYYEKDGDRPRMVFCFADAEEYKDACVPLEVGRDSEYHQLRELNKKIGELRLIMKAGKMNGDYAMLPSESQANAHDLMSRAIAIVEEITGEKWEFS